MHPVGTVDGWALPQQIVDVFDEKKEALVPVLMGFNRGEIQTLPSMLPALPATSAIYESEIRKRYADLAPTFLRLYPSATVRESMLAAVRDGVFGWAAERMVRDINHAGVPAYLYFFDHDYPAASAKGLHAFHASELPFVFGHVGKAAPVSENWPVAQGPEQQALSTAMISYWTSFARTGIPGAAGYSTWPAFGPQGHYMHFTQTPVPATDLLPGMFELNEEVVQRERKVGTLPWIGNVGSAAPVLPGAP